MSPPIVRQPSPDEWQTVRDIRLAALQEAPHAFGSTYEREREKDESWWRVWVGREDDAVFLAFNDDGDDARPVGIDGVFRHDDGTPHLIAMWVAPTARRGGVGAALTRAVIDWATNQGATRLLLDVAEDNPAAIALYESLGFQATGKREPLHSDPTRSVLEMVRAL